MTEENRDPPRIDPRGMDVVYRAVADDLERRIREGEFPYGARLPGREELAAEYGHAPMTIRRATQVLEGKGLVRIVTGKGTYVTHGGPEGTQGAQDDQS